MFNDAEMRRFVSELFLMFVITNIPSLIIGYFLGKKQSDNNWKRESEYKDRELQILNEQLEEQKKAREFEERVHEEGKTNKVHLTKWDINP